MTSEARGPRGNPINQKRVVMGDRRTKRQRDRSTQRRKAIEEAR